MSSCSEISDDENESVSSNTNVSTSRPGSSCSASESLRGFATGTAKRRRLLPLIDFIDNVARDSEEEDISPDEDESRGTESSAASANIDLSTSTPARATGHGQNRSSSTPQLSTTKTSTPSNRPVTDISTLDTKSLLVKMYNRQGEILERLKSLKEENDIKKIPEKIKVPVGIKNAVHHGFKDGKGKGLQWDFEDGKKVDDAANKQMTDNIINFVKGWNPSYQDHTVINCALSRYFVTKKQEMVTKNKNKLESERKKRALYERKKEKAKRRLTALEKMNLGSAKTSKIQKALVPTFMSSDEESHEGFITHQPSWQSSKFQEYKGKLDKKYIEICSTKSKRLLQKRIIGAEAQKDAPEVSDDLEWIIKN